VSATLVEALGTFAAGLRFADLGSDAQASLPGRIIDILGIAVRASTLDTSEAARKFVRSQGNSEQAVAIGLGNRASVPHAAFLNGVLAHSLDYDDTHLPSILHPSASVVPAVLAAAESSGADGPKVLAAIGAGLEITVRLGMAGYREETSQSEFFEHGQHATSICGTVGSAAAASVVLGGSAVDCAHAMAIACSMASGVIEANRTGGTVKRFHCGWAAQAGVTAAFLAASGVTGAATALEGRFGFFQAFLRDQWSPAPILEGLGNRWELDRIFYKPYPANHFTHTLVDAIIAMRADGLRAEEIVSIEVGVASPTVRTIGEPIELKRRPGTGYQAQFSGPFLAAVAAIGGSGLGIGLEDFDDDRLTDPLVQRLMDCTVVVGNSRCDAVYPNQFPAVVRVTSSSGQVREVAVMENLGGPQRPLSVEHLAKKFQDNTAQLLSESAARAVTEGVGRLATPGSNLEFLRVLMKLNATDTLDTTDTTEHSSKTTEHLSQITERKSPLL
jgi:2-methylcitrate dehydratase PrpD